jgi:hypothetical protein
MEIKKSTSGDINKILNYIKVISRRRTILIIFLFIFFLLVCSVSLIYLGANLHRTGRLAGYMQLKNYVRDSNLMIPINYFKSLISNPKSLFIDIKHIDYQKLDYYRRKSIKKGQEWKSSIVNDISYRQITRETQDFVPVKITFNDKKYDAKIRLFGVGIDHYISNKWSFRVVIKGSNRLFGMKRFNLIIPVGREGAIYEYFCHKLAKREGLISLRNDFVDVKINGENKGIYYLEETFDRLLIENNDLRAGVLFKPTIPLQFYHEDEVVTTPQMEKQLALIDKLFNDFLEGNIKTSDLFDIKKMARFYAISDLVNGLHALSWPDNLHFYFNPITALIEPIGREWDVWKSRTYHSLSCEQIHQATRSHFHYRIFEDMEFFKEYLIVLDRISKKEYLDNLFNDIYPDIAKQLNLIHRDHPWYSIKKEFFYKNQESIRKRIELFNQIKAYYSLDSNGRCTILAKNMTNLPIEIGNVIINDSILIVPNKRQILKPLKYLKSSNHDYTQFRIPSPDTIKYADIPKLEFKLLGKGSFQTIDILPWPYEGMIFYKLDFARESPNHGKFHFIKIDENSKIIYFKEGDWELKENLIIPEGYEFVCNKNVAINLVNNSNIFSYSPIKFIGSYDKPINIYSSDSSGQGMLVLNTDQKSILKYVDFHNLSNSSHGGWELTGAINFYESDVEISNCVFSNNRSEDALNIIRSEFEMNETLFQNTLSDAFDGDFTKGIISNSRFINCGNDGIDISGSQIKIKDLFIENAGDKGISVGEKSKMTGKNIKIINSEIGVASKDLSEINLSNLIINETNVGFAAFQKKSEFGPGKITVTNMTINNTETPYLIEKGSTMTVNGKNIKHTDKKVEEILYRAVYGKSSK